MEVNIYTVAEILNAMSLNNPKSLYIFRVEGSCIVVSDDKGEKTLNVGDVNNWLREGMCYINRSRSDAEDDLESQDNCRIQHRLRECCR
jgi:hypothetical protein